MYWDVWFPRDTSPSHCARCQTITPGQCVFTRVIDIEDDHLETGEQSDWSSKKYFKDPRLWSSQFPCSVTWASPRQSCLCCSYDTFIAWCPVHAVSHLQCRRLYTSYLREIPFQSPNLCWHPDDRKRVMSCEMLWVSPYSSSVYSMIIRSHMIPAVRCDCTSQRAVSSWRHRW